MNTDNEIYRSIDSFKISNDALDSISSNVLSNTIKDNINNGLGSFGSSTNNLYKIPDINIAVLNSTMKTPMFIGQLIGLFHEHVSVVTEELDRFFDEMDSYEYSYITFGQTPINRALNITLSNGVANNTYPIYGFEEFGVDNMVDEISRLAKIDNNLEVIINVDLPF